MSLFQKILIANRGEIACRAMRTAKRLGIKTVAVYSTADERAMHVRHADEAICIGDPAPGESYLLIDNIIAACKQSGADAVYPGYGFLSENSSFVQRLAEENIIFIGPNTKAIEAMGDKITSKKIAEQAGVNVIPGYTGVIENASQAIDLAKEIGFPVMLKASAGGGGKGMRIAFNEAECEQGFNRASSEAASSFGDDRVFIEKFIEQPRHIEIQVIADKHGKVLTLNERECSIQRRHQKVIEEAPSPFIDPETRAAMSQQAVQLAQAVDYESAGTVELIVDKNRNFYFLEMNTRLQVEHPVTEAITGVDLIEWMIRVAAGEHLPAEQDDIGINGWAMESRIYAENPERDFMPSIGRLTDYIEPTDVTDVRVDSGVEEGDEISMFYDPMISKLVTHGENRKQAIERMQDALDQYLIRGVESNISFLSSVLSQPDFINGNLTTDFIADNYPGGFNLEMNKPDDIALFMVIAGACHYRIQKRAAQNSDYSEDWVALVNQDQQYPLNVKVTDQGLLVTFQESEYLVEDDWQIGQPLYQGKVNGRPLAIQIERDHHRYTLYHRGFKVSVSILLPRVAELSKYMLEKQPEDLSKFLLSPMPGLLTSLTVSEGDVVRQGAELAIVEAMKMENSLPADQDCTVKSILASVGETLEVDQPIIEFE